MKTISQYIAESNEFCRKIGLNVKEIPKAKIILSKEELLEKKKTYEEILSIAHFFSNRTINLLENIPILIAVTDNNGVLLEVLGDELIKNTVSDVGIIPGIQFDISSMGTNVVNLALNCPHRSVRILGEEHYHLFLHGAACYGATFFDTDRNQVLGTISIMTFLDYQNPMISTVLTTVVDAIEREIILRKQHRKINLLHQVMMDNNQNGVLTTDTTGTVHEFNFRAEILLDRKSSEVIGKNVSLLDKVGEYISNVLRHNRRFRDVKIILQKNGNSFVCLLDAFPIYDELSNITGAFAQFRDITELYEVQEQLDFLANHDEQTGLPNRRYLTSTLNELTERKIFEGEELRFLVIHLDLDRFKNVNDIVGLASGDLLLQQIAERLKNRLNKENFLARVGGDEFIAVLPFTNKKEIPLLCENLLKVFEQPFFMHDLEFHITASLGVTIFPDDSLNPEELIVKANTALFHAKKIAKKQMVYYTKELDIDSREINMIESSLRNAIENDEFVLHYQPQIELQTGRLKGVEALIRWQHPERGLLYPEKFIPIAEESGLITLIDKWVLQNACIQNKQWQDMGIEPFRVAVNISPIKFASKELVGIVKNILEETGLEPEYLELEITETMTMNVDHAIPTLNALHDLGVQISIDDFGTGYSSMNYLTKLSLDRLKIDRSFIWNIDKSLSDSNIVSTIIRLAYNLGLEVIAEGVENKEQLEFLLEHGCDEVQGYYYSKPIPADEVATRINDFKL